MPWLFTDSTGRAAPLRVSNLHSRLYHGLNIHESYDLRDETPASYAVNVATVGLTIPDQDILVTESVLAAMSAVADLRSAPVSIAFGFSHDIDPLDGLEKRFGDAYIAGLEIPAIIEYLCPAHCVANAECPKLFSLNPPVARELSEQFEDTYVVRVGGPDSDVTDRELVVSPTMISKFGLVWSMGFIASDEMFEVIRPLVDNLYFDWFPVPDA